MEAFILVLIVAAVGITVAAVKSGGSNSFPGWISAAQRLGLRYQHSDTMSGPTISGDRRGFRVRVDTHTKSGDNDRTYTRYRVGFENSLGLGLRLAQQGPLAYVSRKLGTQDIAVGDQDFDDAVKVKGRNPELVTQFLTPIRRLGVVRFLSLYPSATIDDAGVECEDRDVTGNPDRIVQTIQRMTTLAEQLTDRGEEKNDYLEAMAQSAEAATIDHTIALPDRPEPWPISLDDLLPAERATAHVEKEADSFIEEPEAFEVPKPPEPEHTDIDELSLEESRPPETVHSCDDGMDIGSLVQNLFAPGHTSSQATEQFDDVYRNKKVAWSGTLTNVRSFRFDLVFGAEAGTRAEFELLKPDDPATWGRAVKAVIRFPVAMEDKLRSLVDHDLGFQGVLTEYDAFMNTLFLVDGKIDEVDS